VKKKLKPEEMVVVVSLSNGQGFYVFVIDKYTRQVSGILVETVLEPIFWAVDKERSNILRVMSNVPEACRSILDYVTSMSITCNQTPYCSHVFESTKDIAAKAANTNRALVDFIRM